MRPIHARVWIALVEKVGLDGRAQGCAWVEEVFYWDLDVVLVFLTPVECGLCALLKAVEKADKRGLGDIVAGAGRVCWR